MIDNGEMPIGFTMELAQHSDALIRFSNLSKDKQHQIIDGARNVNSKQEMKSYVMNVLEKKGGGFHENERAF